MTATLPRCVLLAGGIGGARFALGLRAAVGGERLTVIGNVGDDVELLDLHVSPDLDTVLYTLTRRVGELGWGVRGDTRAALDVVGRLGGPDWFVLGDRDIGLHLVRSQRLRRGEPLSGITADVATRSGLDVRLLPATDDRLRTRIATADGELEFQDWLVGRRARDAALGVRFDGAPAARPAPGVLEAIASADRIVIAPSNPYVSIDPILVVGGVREAVAARRERVVAVTPLIGGRAVKGPLAEMLEARGLEPSALAVAEHLRDVAGAFVLDVADARLAPAIGRLGLRVTSAPTLMHDATARLALARTVLAA